MEQKPIKRIVVWDEIGNCWRDEQTGVDVKGMERPYYDGARSIWQEPLQPNYGDDEAAYQAARKLAGDRAAIEAIMLGILERRTIPAHPMYFIQEDCLITAGWLADQMNAVSARFNQLERRIERLEYPWWKRWLR